MSTTDSKVEKMYTRAKVLSCAVDDKKNMDLKKTHTRQNRPIGDADLHQKPNEEHCCTVAAFFFWGGGG